MRKLLFFAAPFILATLVFLGITFYLNRNSGKGALQVTANPKSNVSINGKLVGQTPLCLCELPDMLASGEYTVSISPLDTSLSSFEEKVTIAPSVLTVVDRTFGIGATSEGSIIALSPLSDKGAVELLAISFPDKAQVFLDRSIIGETPLLSKDLTVSDHQMSFVKEGYKEKTIRIKTVEGYKLTATAFLGIDETYSSQEAPTATPSASPTPTSAKITILSTPTGFLRVRAGSSLSFGEVGRVTPGEVFDILSEEDGWFEIELPNGIKGWVSGQYVQKQ